PFPLRRPPVPPPSLSAVDGAFVHGSFPLHRRRRAATAATSSTTVRLLLSLWHHRAATSCCGPQLLTMPTKDGRQQQEPALHPYEAVRLKQCMQNNARLRQLGLDPIPSSILTTQAAIISNRNKPKDRNGEGSDSAYDPEQDETGEADLSDENTDKDSMASKKSTKTTTKKPRPAKRVLAQQQTTRVTSGLFGGVKQGLNESVSLKRRKRNRTVTLLLPLRFPSILHREEKQEAAPLPLQSATTGEAEKIGSWARQVGEEGSWPPLGN
ncbi:hypothetical protein EJB05_27323, partial [Eragrostis curvula]